MTALRQKTAIVTGAASGIGLAVVTRLSAEGTRIVIGDRQEKEGKAAAQETGADFLSVDLGQRRDCGRLVDFAVEKYGTVDIVINNAGFQHVSPLDSFPEDTWDEMLSVMMTAPFLLTRYAWPHMKKRGWGRIVNIASIHGQVASPFKAGYVSAKHGLLGLTKTAALEGAEHGITVNAICPAYVRTPLVEEQIADQARIRNMNPDTVIEEIMLAPAAIKRLIEPSEVADAVAYLCGPSGGSITGAAWSMDLGWTAR